MLLFNKDTILTPKAKMILDEDIDGLTKEIENGWDINEYLVACQYIKFPPIIIALYYNKLKVVDLLIKNGAELNLKGNPAIPAAADSCSIETIKLLLNHGAKLNAVNNCGTNAMGRALISKRYDIMIGLISLGMDVMKDGSILRSAVFDNDYHAIRILLDQGIDVNYHTPDMVFPYNSTAVQVAAEKNDLEMVKLLVEHGADVTIKNDYGDRPYTAALRTKNNEMIEYIKSLEPTEWHNEEQRLLQLKSYKLPKNLIAFLRKKDLLLKTNSNIASYLIFNTLEDCKEVKWNGYKFLDLLSEVDNYSAEGFLVWYPKNRCLASADYEHDEFRILDDWDTFIKDPSKTIDKIFE